MTLGWSIDTVIIVTSPLGHQGDIIHVFGKKVFPKHELKILFVNFLCPRFLCVHFEIILPTEVKGLSRRNSAYIILSRVI